MKKRLPRFSLKEYADLIGWLKRANYRFQTISQLKEAHCGRVAFMRHDVDMHLFQIDMMAAIEAGAGIRATYFILLTQHYNPLEPQNREILRRIVNWGHEIGLHYDLASYPSDLEAASARLEWETNVLSEVTGVPVRSVAMHQPHQGREDPFRTHEKYVHPHDPRYQGDILYVSDSCRAWRDESLLSIYAPTPPVRLLLTTHPELWLDGTIEDRMVYLDRILANHALTPYRAYFEETVREVWRTHPGPNLHDARERREKESRRIEVDGEPASSGSKCE